MIDNHNDTKLITDTVNLYFKGTYQGDAAQLIRAFHPEARVTGSLKDQLYDWTLAEFIERVTATPTARDKKELYNKEIVFIDQSNNAAMVKARVNVGNLIFIDYISLLKINGEWVIRNKSFSVI